ncbi:MAG: response regulator [Actinomycetota bacterium]
MLSARVLVVQTREALAHATGRLLQGAGFEPVLARDGNSAVRLAAADPPAAVLLDLTLPTLDGWFVLAELGGAPDPPALVVYSHPGDFERAERLGADACVSDHGAVVHALQRVTEATAKRPEGSGAWSRAGEIGNSWGPGGVDDGDVQEHDPWRAHLESNSRPPTTAGASD